MSSSALIINILIGYGALQAFFIALILLRSTGKSLFNRLFAALLIIEGFTLIERLLFETELINDLPHLLGISHPISFIKPPLMLFMARAITNVQFRLKRKHLLQLIPFGLMLCLNLPFYLSAGPDKLNMVRNFMEKVPSYQSFDFYFTLSFFGYIGIYIALALRLLRQFRHLVKNHILVNWYRTILLAYSGFLMMHLLYFMVQPIIQSNFAIINNVSMLAMTFIIQAIALKMMGQSHLLQIKTTDLGDLQQRQVHEELIINKFEQDKIYLDDELNLQVFATAISLSPAHVSKIINQKFNCSFTKLVAQYRVKEAKRIIQDSNDASSIKLINVAFQAGFSNKVSFYRAFKEFEQKSPTEYLNVIKKQQKK